MFVVARSTWERWSAEDQAIVRQAAIDSAMMQRDLWAAREASSEALVRAAGATIVQVEDKTPFITAMQPVYDQFVTSDALRDLLARVQATE